MLIIHNNQIFFICMQIYLTLNIFSVSFKKMLILVHQRSFPFLDFFLLHLSFEAIYRIFLELEINQEKLRLSRNA